MMDTMTNVFQGTANKKRRITIAAVAYPFPEVSKSGSTGSPTSHAKSERDESLTLTKHEKVKLLISSCKAVHADV